MKLGFIGTGKISESVITGIFKSKIKYKRIFISKRNYLISKRLKKSFKKITIEKDNDTLYQLFFIFNVLVNYNW